MPGIPSPRDFPFSLQELRSEFDRLLDRVWHVGLNTAPLDGQDWAPNMDVVETKDSFCVRVEVPGLAAEAVELSILGNTLWVKGSKPPPVEQEDGRRRLRAECRYGGFCRKYDFPTPVQQEGITATTKNGVLSIIVLKAPEVMGRKVTVQPQE